MKASNFQWTQTEDPEALIDDLLSGDDPLLEGAIASKNATRIAMTLETICLQLNDFINSINNLGKLT